MSESSFVQLSNVLKKVPSILTLALEVETYNFVRLINLVGIRNFFIMHHRLLCSMDADVIRLFEIDEQVQAIQTIPFRH